MKAIYFMKNFVRFPQMIGAVCPSSKRLAKKMVKTIDFKNIKCIVEYGAGTGVFTEQIIKNKKEDTVLLVMELNDELYLKLNEKYGDMENVHIIHDSAERVEWYLNKYGFKEADYIVSGLPFTSFPKDLSQRILEQTKKVLRKKGQFITFQYTLVMKKYMHEFFQDINLGYEAINIPPAFIFYCNKKA